MNNIVYVTYIHTSPEKLWNALTDPELTPNYFFGRKIVSDWEIGSRFKLIMQNGRVDSQGRVIDYDPPRWLSLVWHVEWIKEYQTLPNAIVTFHLAPMGDVVCLTFKEIFENCVSEKIMRGRRHSWPIIISGLKTFLETGTPLPIYDWEY